MLFDDFERTETRYRNQREPTFTYLNLSARAQVTALRSVLEEWFETYPNGAAKNDLRSRFRSRRVHQHDPAFWELYLFRLFSRLGFVLQPHPDIEGSSNHPEFLVMEGATPRFYLEAVVAGLPSNADAGADARLAEVFDLVNTMQIPGWFLHVQHSGRSDTAPPIKKLRKDLEAWLASQGPYAMVTTPSVRNWNDLPRFEWSYEDLTLTFSISPRSSTPEGKANSRPIGSIIGEAKSIETAEDIRKAVGNKAKKYGALSLPLVVAINVVNWSCDLKSTFDALLGTEMLSLASASAGPHLKHVGRQPDGGWFGKDGPRNETVSAVLVGSEIHPYSCCLGTPLLIHCPFPTHPLELPSYPLPEWRPDASAGEMVWKNGKDAREILGFPNPWPPVDD